MDFDYQNFVLEALSDLAEDFRIDDLGSISADTRLWGAKSSLDSMSLVALVSELEARISERFKLDIVIADETAFDRRLSPFARVSTLADFIKEKVESSRAESSLS